MALKRRCKTQMQYGAVSWQRARESILKIKKQRALVPWAIISLHSNMLFPLTRLLSLSLMPLNLKPNWVIYFWIICVNIRGGGGGFLWSLAACFLSKTFRMSVNASIGSDIGLKVKKCRNETKVAVGDVVNKLVIIWLVSWKIVDKYRALPEVRDLLFITDCFTEYFIHPYLPHILCIPLNVKW